MDAIDKALSDWKDTLCKSIDVGGLLARNPIAHKWKAPFRSLSLREAIGWRMQDLLFQSKLLFDQRHLLGARILLRAAFETLGVLVHLNQLMMLVVSEDLEFNEFSDKTTVLLLGSRDGSTDYKAINVVTILQKCDQKYPGIVEIYEGLCESAHPNYEGLSGGYSRIDHDEYITRLSNRWAERFSASHSHGIALCIETFFHEYNDEWIEAMTKLEEWIVENDERLERGKFDA